MGIEAADLPDLVYLVRSPDASVAGPGLTVHGTVRDLSLVSGDPESIARLSARRCFVAEWTPVIHSTAPRRTWKAPKTADPRIQTMVDELTWADYRDDIQWLVDFGTRYSYTATCAVVAESLQVRFAGLGLDAGFHTFTHNDTQMHNVVATQTGVVYPDSIFVICGHYDSISEIPDTLAPGADDNGTGTATVLAAARILSQHSFAYTIRYICFAGEEQILKGSYAYAADALAAGDAIVGVLNYDMIGYWEPGVEADLEIETNQASQWLATAVTTAASLYTGAAWELHVYDNAWWGDHYPFWVNGYAAVNHEESWDWGDPDFNPYYHTTSDLMTYVGQDFALSNAKVAVASLATLAQPQSVTAVTDPVPGPAAVHLRTWPNPFNGSVRIQADASPDLSRLDVDIFDSRGRMVATLSLRLEQGHGTADWNARDARGHRVQSGVYFCQPRGGLGPTVRITYVK
jgi:hypothetical protein